MCTNKLHLSRNDKLLLKALRIAPWYCPQCQPTPPPPKPKLRLEENEVNADGREDSAQ